MNGVNGVALGFFQHLQVRLPLHFHKQHRGPVSTAVSPFLHFTALFFSLVTSVESEFVGPIVLGEPLQGMGPSVIPTWSPYPMGKTSNQ